MSIQSTFNSIRHYSFIPLLVFLFSGSIAFAAPGDLDTSFGTDGIVTTAVRSSDDHAYAIAVQTDGKIIAGGASATSAGGVNNDFALVRYNSDGSIDTSFGTDGQVVTDLSSDNDQLRSLALQTDGKIVAVGNIQGANVDFGLVRYNSDGTLDTSFGTNGVVTTHIGFGNDRPFAVAIQTDGKIVVAGYSSNGSNDDFTLVRYNSDGTVDTSFGIIGVVTTDIASDDDRIYSMTLQSDGKIIVAGSSKHPTETFALARYNTNGTLDTSFGTGGVITTDIGTSSIAYSVKLQTDEKIVVVGSSNNSINTDIALARYSSDGALDTSFGTSGIVTTDVSAGTEGGFSVAIQTDGKIVIAGDTIDSGFINFNILVIRYNQNGTIDETFLGDDGVVSTSISDSDHAYAMKLDSEGRIVIAGSTVDFQNFNYFVLARYQGNPLVSPKIIFTKKSSSNKRIKKLKSVRKSVRFYAKNQTKDCTFKLRGVSKKKFKQKILNTSTGENITAEAVNGTAYFRAGDVLKLTMKPKGRFKKMKNVRSKAIIVCTDSSGKFGRAKVIFTVNVRK